MPSLGNKPSIIILSLVGIALLYLLAPVLTPFLISALLAYLSNPAVNLLMRCHLPRLLSVIIVFIGMLLLFLLLILLVIPLIEKQIVLMIQTAPAMIAWIQSVFAQLIQEFDLPSLSTENMKGTLTNNMSDVNSVATWIGKKIFYSGLSIVGFIVNIFLVLVVTFYLLRDWYSLISNIQSLLPRSIEPTITMLAQQCDAVLSAFIRGQLLVMLSLGVIYSVGLSMVGLSLGFIIGMIAGAASIVPYLGFIVGISAASIASFVQFNSWSPIIYVFAVFIIGQLIEGTILTPLLVGKSIGLHPVAVIFAVLAGGALFGFFGILLALPVASVIMVLLRYINNRYQQSDLYQAAK